LKQRLEEQKVKEQGLVNQLVKHTQMLDQVMNFRDKESSREYHELLHENADLSAKCERWRERAQMLQQERWSFVKKWQDAKAEAEEARDRDGGSVLHSDDKADEEDSERPLDSDDDW
jgi:hypothetical protein